MSYERKVLIIPDSNFVFVNNKKKANFELFVSNERFNNLIKYIESNEFREDVSLAYQR